MVSTPIASSPLRSLSPQLVMLGSVLSKVTVARGWELGGGYLMRRCKGFLVSLHQRQCFGATGLSLFVPCRVLRSEIKLCAFHPFFVAIHFAFHILFYRMGYNKCQLKAVSIEHDLE